MRNRGGSGGGVWRRARLLLAGVCLVATPALAEGDAEKGAMVFALAGGCGCHTPEGGPVGAGGRDLPTPFGTFYGTNITPDPETGLGDWSDEEIIAAIRDGYARDKGVEAPVMPYPLYSGMADEDVRNLVAYLRTLPAVQRENRPAEVRLPLPRLAFAAWRLIFAGRASAAERAPEKGVERGHYLVNHVAICGDCHTPRNALGSLDGRMYLAGTAHGPDGDAVPNITPDRTTGVGSWDISDLTQLLQSGMKPDFDNVQGLMAEVVDGRAGGLGYTHAPQSDLRAMAAYLKTVKPIDHEVD